VPGTAADGNGGPVPAEFAGSAPAASWPDPPAPADRPAFPDWFNSPELAPADIPAPDKSAPSDEPVPPDGAGAYSWSGRTVSPAAAVPPDAAVPPASSVPPTKPIPIFSQIAWVAVVTQDRAYFEQMQAMGVQMGPDVAFPALTPERRFPLGRQQLRIGRSSAGRDLKPEIDLSGLPADPGISRLHALLVPAPNGTWAVLDPGSANGTLLNGREIPVGELVTLHEGDRINIGAWTAITICRE
jgi:FHA domain